MESEAKLTSRGLNAIARILERIQTGSISLNIKGDIKACCLEAKQLISAIQHQKLKSLSVCLKFPSFFFRAGLCL